MVSDLRPALPGKAPSGGNREGRDPHARHRGGPSGSSEEGQVIGPERSGRVIQARTTVNHAVGGSHLRSRCSHPRRPGHRGLRRPSPRRRRCRRRSSRGPRCRSHRRDRPSRRPPSRRRPLRLSDSPPPARGIEEIDAGGGDRRPLVADHGRYRVAEADFSPDGRTITFVEASGERTRLSVSEADGRDARRLAPAPSRRRLVPPFLLRRRPDLLPGRWTDPLRGVRGRRGIELVAARLARGDTLDHPVVGEVEFDPPRWLERRWQDHFRPAFGGRRVGRCRSRGRRPRGFSWSPGSRSR